MSSSHSVDFKTRSVFSFAKSLESLSEISNSIYSDYKPLELGVQFVSVYKSLGHSIEMFCKAVLESHSKVLLLERIVYVDSLRFDEKKIGGERLCGGAAAFARASKFFKKRKTIEELVCVEKIIERRNLAQHGTFEIENFKTQYHEVVAAIILFLKLYKEEIGNLERAAQKVTEIDIKVLLDDVKRETDKDFIAAENCMIEKMGQGIAFRLCTACRYPFAQLSSDKQSFECIWCEAERKRVKCAHCDTHAWVKPEKTEFICKQDLARHKFLVNNWSALELLAGYRVKEK